MTEAIASYGTTISWNGQVIGEVKSASGPGMSWNAVDVSHLSSADAFKEFIMGFGDGGEISFECNFLPGDTNGQIAMITDAYARTKRTVVITGPTAAAFTWTATCGVSGIDPGFDPEGQLTISFTLKVSGKPVLAITASGGLTGLTGIEENAGGALTFVPAFAAGATTYAATVNTASTWIKLTPTAAAHTITISNGTSSQTVTSGAQSGEIDLGAADSVTTVTITATESGKVAQVTTIYVTRPAP